MIRIMLSAGEVSGDSHGAVLVREIKNLKSSVYLFGMGGEKMRAAGVDVRLDLTAKGTVGFFEILRFLPSILFVMSKMKLLLRKERPDLLVLIDYQGFNMLLAKYAKKIGVRTIYYIPPQEWLWGTEKGVKDVAKTIDKILSIFENEALAYEKAGGSVVFVGNPNLDTSKPTMSKDAFCRFAGINPSFPVLGIFPGSRRQEIDSLLPVFLGAAKEVREKIPNISILLSLSSENFRSLIEKGVAKSGLAVKILYGRNFDILNTATASLVASGTAVMEAAILDAPIIMAYKVSPVSYFIGKHLLKIRLPYYSMPNLILNSAVVPEFIQGDATIKNIAEKALCLLSDRTLVSDMRSGYRRFRMRLGSGGAVKAAAKEILSEVKGKV